MQLQFCQKKQNYDQKYRKLEVAVSQYESKLAILTQKHQNYLSKIGQLQELERRFVEMREALMKLLG